MVECLLLADFVAEVGECWIEAAAAREAPPVIRSLGAAALTDWH
jgi:hypothetical protein